MFFCFLAGGIQMLAQDHIAHPDTVVLHPDSVILHLGQDHSDSLLRNPVDTIKTDALVSDSLHYDFSDAIQTDTLTADSLHDILADAIMADSLAVIDTIPSKPGFLEAPVTYQAKDSIVLTAGNMAYLYGEGDVKYQQIQLQAELIEMSMDNSEIFATFVVDSTGYEFGYPLYIDGSEQFEAKSMRYNFKTRKGHSIDVLTQQGEGYLTAKVAKKMEDNAMNLIDGQYTTCEEHDHPHYYIQLTKAKTRPGKDIVSGPLYLVIEDVPLPLALPFAFFPFTDTYSSGIIMPTYGEETTRGFFLRDGGYYFALSDYVDLALRGDFYTKGSWGVSALSSYRKRYKYSGGFDLRYLVTKYGDKGFDDYSVEKAFSINWNHSQDAKANPYRTFSASINFSTNQYDRNEIKGQALPSTTANTKGSSINISQRFPNSPWNISATMNINQNSRDSTLNVTLPTLMINMSMTAPFKRKNAIGPERWYEKIKLSYTGNLQNSSGNVKESEFLKKNVIRDWRNGMNHQIPVSATYSLLGYINISPSFNYQERWYTSKEHQSYDTIQRTLINDTTYYGFYRVYNYSASVSAGTTLYGFYKPWSIFGGFVNMIRHRMEPSISYTMTPNFGDPKYGYHEKYSYMINGVEITDYYSPFRNQLFGYPGRGKQGNIAFSLNNNFEAKIRSNQDSTGLKKISLIDNLSYNIGYNLAEDSLNWTNSNVALRMKLSKSYTLTLNGQFDTYIYAYNEQTQQPVRINTPRWKVGKGLGRLISTSTSFQYTFDNNFINTIKGWFGKGNSTDETKTDANQSDGLDEENISPNPMPDTQTPGTRMRGARQTQAGEYDDDGYYNTTMPWSFNINYSLSLGRGAFNPEKMEYDYVLRHNLSFSGNIQPTSKWRLNFNGSYDFDQKKIPYLALNVSRDLHCFQMSASIVPVGYRKSYMFSIAVSSSLLKDLKYNQSSNYWNGLSWY